ncbi:hypothetical protein MJO28_001163 [Puccinia striiformis f. sp. tritici]|uniref:Uncharacterized protein n=1 Tax=Puccinia striiformis f. sp. tritici TaxID=168172 RepID=A0ACC0F104_9BASI|nr:hypothetical protein MJO28_001163 [Puccinia striiformis f. sp. tritici]
MKTISVVLAYILVISLPHGPRVASASLGIETSHPISFTHEIPLDHWDGVPSEVENQTQEHTFLGHHLISQVSIRGEQVFVTNPFPIPCFQEVEQDSHKLSHMQVVNGAHWALLPALTASASPPEQYLVAFLEPHLFDGQSTHIKVHYSLPPEDHENFKYIMHLQHASSDTLPDEEEDLDLLLALEESRKTHQSSQHQPQSSEAHVGGPPPNQPRTIVADSGEPSQSKPQSSDEMHQSKPEIQAAAADESPIGSPVVHKSHPSSPGRSDHTTHEEYAEPRASSHMNDAGPSGQNAHEDKSSKTSFRDKIRKRISLMNVARLLNSESKPNQQRHSDFTAVSFKNEAKAKSVLSHQQSNPGNEVTQLVDAHTLPVGKSHTVASEQGASSSHDDTKANSSPGLQRQASTKEMGPEDARPREHGGQTSNRAIGKLDEEEQMFDPDADLVQARRRRASIPENQTPVLKQNQQLDYLRQLFEKELQRVVASDDTDRKLEYAISQFHSGGGFPSHLKFPENIHKRIDAAIVLFEQMRPPFKDEEILDGYDILASVETATVFTSIKSSNDRYQWMKRRIDALKMFKAHRERSIRLAAQQKAYPLPGYDDSNL